jgi:hypothetical protein
LTQPWIGDEGQPTFYRQITDYDEKFLAEIEGLLDTIDIPDRNTAPRSERRNSGPSPRLGPT